MNLFDIKTARDLSVWTLLKRDKLSENSAGWEYTVIKRLLDLLLSFVLLILFSPIMLIVAVAIKVTSKGPVIFSQRLAIGKDEKPFTLYKFRTMYTHLDDSIHRDATKKFVKGEPIVEVKDKHGPQKVYKIINDKRVTPIGQILRKTGLDEVPQFYNVLKGEMSIVGPRPPLRYEYELYHAEAKKRLQVLPGITGLYQVTARSRLTFDEMVKLDLSYIQNRGLWLDLKIIFMTPWVMVTGKGAH
ncbi:MAG: sugar transferase [bacterium]